MQRNIYKAAEDIIEPNKRLKYQQNAKLELFLIFILSSFPDSTIRKYKHQKQLTIFNHHHLQIIINIPTTAKQKYLPFLINPIITPTPITNTTHQQLHPSHSHIPSIINTPSTIQPQIMQYQQLNQEPQPTSTTSPKYGNMIPICNSTPPPTFLLGPHYYIFIPTFTVMTIITILMYININSIISQPYKIILASTITILLISYLLLGLTNPGIDINHNNNRRINAAFCDRCGIVRQLGTKHCWDCDICIKGYDHHCPWIGKCVGQQNKHLFYIFLTMIFSTIIVFFLATMDSVRRQQTPKQI